MMNNNPFNHPDGTPATIKALAVRIRRGFEHHTGFLDKRFARPDTRLDSPDARVGRIAADPHGPRCEVVYRHECDDVFGRLTYLEKKLGSESGG
jgi:hypothetical protein